MIETTESLVEEPVAEQIEEAPSPPSVEAPIPEEQVDAHENILAEIEKSVPVVEATKPELVKENVSIEPVTPAEGVSPVTTAEEEPEVALEEEPNPVVEETEPEAIVQDKKAPAVEPHVEAPEPVADPAKEESPAVEQPAEELPSETSETLAIPAELAEESGPQQEEPLVDEEIPQPAPAYHIPFEEVEPEVVQSPVKEETAEIPIEQEEESLAFDVPADVHVETEPIPHTLIASEEDESPAVGETEHEEEPVSTDALKIPQEEERPKSPWTPSYSVSIQGGDSSATEQEVDELEQLPPPVTATSEAVEDSTLVVEEESVVEDTSAVQDSEPQQLADEPVVEVIEEPREAVEGEEEIPRFKVILRHKKHATKADYHLL